MSDSKLLAVNVVPEGADKPLDVAPLDDVVDVLTSLEDLNRRKLGYPEGAAKRLVLLEPEGLEHNTFLRPVACDSLELGLHPMAGAAITGVDLDDDVFAAVDRSVMIRVLTDRIDRGAHSARHHRGHCNVGAGVTCGIGVDGTRGTTVRRVARSRHVRVAHRGR